MLLVFNLSSSHAKWTPAGNWLAVNGHGLSSATYTSGVLQFVGLDAFIAYGDT
jgi:hypothetical protein